MENVQQEELVYKDAGVVIGLKWEGTFAEAGAGGIRAIQTEFKRRVHEIKNVLHPDELLGLSYHMTETGFIHYVAVEVSDAALQSIPDGMVAIDVPSQAYVRYNHLKGQSVESSYHRIYSWIKEQGYALSNGALTHYEMYPMEQDPYDLEPEFIILVPVNEKKSN